MQSFFIKKVLLNLKLVSYSQNIKVYRFFGIKRKPFSLNTCFIEVILKVISSSNWSGERVDT